MSESHEDRPVVFHTDPDEWHSYPASYANFIMAQTDLAVHENVILTFSTGFMPDPDNTGDDELSNPLILRRKIVARTAIPKSALKEFVDNVYSNYENWFGQAPHRSGPGGQ